jgi:hypothetical protein
MEEGPTHISVPNDVGGNPEGADDKPMSASQANQLKMLAAELGAPVDFDLTARQAARKIAELEKMAGRGAPKDA